MANVIKSNSIMWSQTPLNKREPNISWSEDAMIRIYDTGRTDTFDKYIQNSGKTFVDYIVYVLYYDSKDSMTYLKDVRENIIYSIPSGGNSKGYTLALKLNVYYNKYK